MCGIMELSHGETSIFGLSLAGPSFEFGNLVVCFLAGQSLYLRRAVSGWRQMLRLNQPALDFAGLDIFRSGRIGLFVIKCDCEALDQDFCVATSDFNHGDFYHHYQYRYGGFDDPGFTWGRDGFLANGPQQFINEHY